jgi:hypothetical protein
VNAVRRPPYRLLAFAATCLASALGLLASACGDDDASQEDRADGGVRGELPYASELVSFEVGDKGGYGKSKLPGVVLGPPKGGGTGAGSLDVLSLGVGGEIVLGFGEREISDGPGADLIVFENAFWANGDPDSAFIEPGEVAVSADGERWHVFPCDPDAAIDEAHDGTGCAGLHPVLAYEAARMHELDPDETGGDAFDLAAIDVPAARYVRIRDLVGDGEGTSAGFDLDAVGAINYRSR